MNQQLSWRTIVGYSLGDVANNFAFAMGGQFGDRKFLYVKRII